MTAPAQSAREAVVVEDDEDIARLLKFIVEREGFRVRPCSDGRIGGGTTFEMPRAPAPAQEG